MIDRLDQDPAGNLRAWSPSSRSTLMSTSTCACPRRSASGTYSMTADFIAGGGLYKNANVTYRGVAIGRVESVGLTATGIVTGMRLNSGSPVPTM